MRSLTIIVVALLLTACGQWTRPDTTEAELKRDSDECDLEARLMSFPMPSSPELRAPTNPDDQPSMRRLFADCMKARGYFSKY